MLHGDTNPKIVGKQIILPSSFTGSPRYMTQNYQDTMAKITQCLEFIEGQNVED